MRLLVYGGTQYSERRRIGEWPASISSAMLQSRSGLSELRTVYGVGVFADSVFVLLRGIQTYEQRGYPLTLLLDPGELWSKFEWNGALLLHCLLHASPEVGNTLLTRPETINSPDDLKRVLLQLGDPPPLASETDASFDGNPFSHFYTAALALDQPLLIGLQSNSLGLEPYPPYNRMAARLALLPRSLRAALGWVIGGDADYQMAFNAKLVFEDSKESAPRVADQVSRLTAQGQFWLADWLSVKESAAAVAHKELADLFEQPLAQWEQSHLAAFADYTRKDLFADLRCLSLLQRGGNIANDETIFNRLDQIVGGQVRSPFGPVANDLLLERIKKSRNRLLPFETSFLMHQVFRNENEQTKAGIDLNTYELDDEAALSFLTNARIYPSSDERVPKSLWTELALRLLSTEDQDIHLRLIREIEHAESLTADQRRRLIIAAVERTAGRPEGMECWLNYRNDSKLAAEIKAAATLVALNEVKDKTGSWQRDYLLFSGDSDGGALLEESPGVIASVVEFALDAQALRHHSKVSMVLKEFSREWLEGIGHSQLRNQISLTHKLAISEFGLSQWRGLSALKAAFGDLPRANVSALVELPDPAEREFLLRELGQLIDSRDQLDDRPISLTIVAKLFDNQEIASDLDAFSAALQPLLPLKPDLNDQRARSWVQGWYEIANRSKIKRLNTPFREKFRQEAVRYLLNPQIEQTADWPFELRDLDDDERGGLQNVLRRLLFQGEHSADTAYRNRVHEFSSEIKKQHAESITIVFQNEIGEPESVRTFLRRFPERSKPLGVLKKIVGDDLWNRLHAATKNLRDETTRAYKAQLEGLFWESPVGNDFAEKFFETIELAAVRGQLDKEAFETALNNIFTDFPLERHDVFLDRVASGEHVVAEIRTRLSAGGLARFTELMADYEIYQLSLTIEKFLSASDDRRLEFNKFMQRKQSDRGLKRATSAAVRRCLREASEREIFYERFMLTSKKNGRIRLRIKRQDSLNHLNFLFANLEPPAQRELIEFIYKKNPDAFHEMVARGFEQLKNDYLKGSIKLRVEVFNEAIFTFLWTQAGQSAREQLVIGEGAQRDLTEGMFSWCSDRAHDMEPNSESSSTQQGPDQTKTFTVRSILHFIKGSNE